jgi:hypothetical protein
VTYVILYGDIFRVHNFIIYGYMENTRTTNMYGKICLDQEVLNLGREIRHQPFYN